MIDPFVDTAWLRAHPNAVVADVRWYLDGRRGRDVYERGHIPGAVFVDLDAVLAGPSDPAHGRHPLPAPDAFARDMGRLGVGEGDAVVAYEDAGGVIAARLVWMLRALGEEAALLDGGIGAWDGELEKGSHSRAAADFTTRDWPTELLAGIDELDGERVLVDARDGERYRGEVEPIDPRAGHIPGARSVPCRGNLARDGRLLDDETLRRRFDEAGVSAASGVVSYCGSGITACHNLLVLEHIGRGRGRLFPGSWSQWSQDYARSAATGPQRG